MKKKIKKLKCDCVLTFMLFIVTEIKNTDSIKVEIWCWFNVELSTLVHRGILMLSQRWKVTSIQLPFSTFTQCLSNVVVQRCYTVEFWWCHNVEEWRQFNFHFQPSPNVFSTLWFNVVTALSQPCVPAGQSRDLVNKLWWW